jgi:hypothetical protein
MRRHSYHQLGVDYLSQHPGRWFSAIDIARRWIRLTPTRSSCR